MKAKNKILKMFFRRDYGVFDVKRGPFGGVPFLPSQASSLHFPTITTTTTTPTTLLGVTLSVVETPVGGGGHSSRLWR
jgi:hypothetical protein